MRQLLYILVIAILFVIQYRPLESIWSKNLASLKLWPLWAEQQAKVPNPPCSDIGDFSELEQSFRDSVTVQPGDRSATIHLGRVLWLNGDCQEAVALWEKASLLQDLIASHELFRVGRFEVVAMEDRLFFSNKAYAMAGKFKLAGEEALAREWYWRAFELYPSRKTADFFADTYQQAGDTAAIEQLWIAVAEKLPEDNPEHWWAKAKLLALQEQWDASAQAFLRGAELTDNPFDYWMRAGSAWEQVKDWKQAIDAYCKAHKVRPKDMWAVVGIARSLRYQEQHKEALMWYNLAQVIAHDHYAPYYFLGEYAYSRQDYPKAQKYLEAALAIRPDHVWSLFYLAQVMHQVGEPDAAVMWLSRAITSYAPKPPSQWLILIGDWQLERANCDEANEAYQVARMAGASESTIEERSILLGQSCEKGE